MRCGWRRQYERRAGPPQASSHPLGGQAQRAVGAHMSYGAVSQGSNALASDARSLNALKFQAGQNTPAAIKETAKQFEALFMREMIKSMREATMKSGLLDSPQGDLGTDLLDQQLAVQMSGRPGGLSDLIAKQLTRQMAGAEATAWDKQSDEQMHQHHRWAQSTTVLQVSIALAAIALLTKKKWLEVAMFIAGGAGLVVGVLATLHI